MSPIKSRHGQYLTDINRENKMEKIMVELEDGSTGSLTFEFVFNTLLGKVATVDSRDGNGMDITSTGKIVSVLYF